MYVCALCARCQRARTYLLWLFLCHRRARPMPHSRLFAATPAKLHSHDAMPHRARTVCVLCSHCLACCGMAVCARVRSGISLSSASLLSLSALAHFLLPPSSSSSAKCYVLLIKSHGATAGSASIRKTYLVAVDGRALVDSKNIIIIFIYLLRRRHRAFSVCARACVLSTSATRQRHATP